MSTQAKTTAQMRRRQGWKGTPGANGSWVVTVALAVLIFSATNLLWPIFDTNSWSAKAIVLVTIMLGAAALVRTFTGSQLWALIASIVGGAVVLVGFTGRGRRARPSKAGACSPSSSSNSCARTQLLCARPKR